MNLDLRIPAHKCSKRVLELILTKVQNENISVSEAFAQLLDQVAEHSLENQDASITAAGATRQPDAENQST